MGKKFHDRLFGGAVAATLIALAPACAHSSGGHTPVESPPPPSAQPGGPGPVIHEHFVGANLWYGMNLGSTGAGGDRARLTRELDRLQALGVHNLRVIGSSEGPTNQPWRIAPAAQEQPGVYGPELFNGLDYLLDEMGKRHMRAVVCLNNFWHWSGGMSQYLQWTQGGAIPYPPPAAGGTWGGYMNYTAQFYVNPLAIEYANSLLRSVVGRQNALNGKNYRDDSTIYAWELANEPRGMSNVEAFNDWIDATSTLIRSIDNNHYITTGSEGQTPTPGSAGMDFVRNHKFANIDYATLHIWAQNWGWYDPANAEHDFPVAVAKMKDYLNDHIARAKILKKPIVIEEFGFPRDGGSFDPSSTTVYRDRYYSEMFQAILDAINNGAPIAGVNFWAWGGEGRPVAPFGGYWQSGNAWLGDPPHEQQGWYSVYDTDTSTLKIIADYAARISAATAAHKK